ncbi:MAG: hypothetical protein M3N21_06695, partial [Actinomycetota bacterium]|nr:hypothetical protein [Actinomycetota bacterium]
MDWSPPVALDSGGAEPSIRVAPDGRSAAYISAPSGLGSNFWRIDESVDSSGSTHLTPTVGVQPDLGTGGGDAEISVGTSVDPATGCAPIAYSGLHNIDLFNNFTVSHSTDCGKTFSLLNPYATQNTLTDRQWQTFDGSKTNHLLYHKVDTGQIVDSRSEDGGMTYVTLGTPAGVSGVVDPLHAYTIQNVKIGNVVTDQTRPVSGKTYPVSGEQVHTLWATFAGTRDAADTVASKTLMGPVFNHRDTIYVARSDDGGLTWTDTTSYTTAASSTRELDLIFPVISVDGKGNVYSAWTDGNLVQYSVSTDGGTTWSKAYTVNPGEAGAVATGGTADLFPWIAAGADGRLDVVWYHGSGGDTTGYRSVGSAGTTWTVAFAQLADATRSDSTGALTPTVVSSTLAASPVLHTGNVCNNGTTCGLTNAAEDRTLLDFFQVAIDGRGRANIAYASDAGTPKTAHIEYIRQNSGQSLLDGSAIKPNVFATGPTQVVCSADGTITDPSGDATGVLSVQSTPTPSQDDLDVVRAFWSTTGTGPNATLTSHVKVKNLGTQGGQYFRFYFTFNNVKYLTVASRDLTGATFFDLEADGATGATTLKTVSGTFDVAGNEATVSFSLADFTATAKPAKPFILDSLLESLQVLAQRNTTAATLTSDTATGTCPYVIGAAVRPESAPSASPSSASPSPSSASPSPSSASPSPSSASPSPSSASPSPSSASPSPSSASP